MHLQLAAKQLPATPQLHAEVHTRACPMSNHNRLYFLFTFMHIGIRTQRRCDKDAAFACTTLCARFDVLAIHALVRVHCQVALKEHESNQDKKAKKEEGEDADEPAVVLDGKEIDENEGWSNEEKVDACAWQC